MEVRTRGEERFDHACALGEDVLAVVQYQKEAARLKCGHQSVKDIRDDPVVDPAPRGHGVRDERRVGETTQIHPSHAIREDRAALGGDLRG